MVGDEQLHYLTPCLVQSLIPNASGKVLLYLNFLLKGYLIDLLSLFLYLLLSLLDWDFVDFVDEHEYICIVVVLLDTIKSQRPILKALLQSLLGIFNVEHIDEYLHSSEDGFFLDKEVLLHEGVLASAVP